MDTSAQAAPPDRKVITSAPMFRNDRFLARLVAALFVITMLMGMVDAYSANPILEGPLADIHQQASAVLLGGLMRLFMAIGIVGIALGFLPVVRRHSETIALTYLVFRTAECVLLGLGVSAHIFLIDLSRQYTDAGASADETFSAMAQGALGFTRTTYQMAMTILGIGSILLCWVLLRSRLIPAWIAWLGIVGYVSLLASAILDLIGAVDTVDGAGAIMYIPGGIFELIVLPAWLWFKGFNPVAPEAGSTVRQAALVSS